MLWRSTAGAGSFSTRGGDIVDAEGHAVRLAAVNWFGLETRNAAPEGLGHRVWSEMMDQMKSLGFNTIRLPFSADLIDGLAPVNINYALNPDLVGLRGVQLIDKIVDYAGQIGMRVILDRHRDTAGDGSTANGLWYGAGGHTEAEWISDWVALANRYAGNSTVIGADLHNEPHGSPSSGTYATWGGGGATDWAAAAERAGKAIQAVNPDWLIVVEGVEYHQRAGDPNGSDDYYWWGGNLQGVGARPIQLDVANRVVYSPHDYPNSLYGQPWFQGANFPANMAKVFDTQWGYIAREGIAPILLGEFGTRLQDPKDVQWLQEILQTLNGDFNRDGQVDAGAPKAGVSWSWWSWTHNSGDTGGILQDDWRTPIAEKLNYLAQVAGPGFAPNRVHYATAGNDTFTGGYGLDTVIENGVSSGWRVVRQGDSVLIANPSTGEIDRAVDVEQVRFADRVLVDVRALPSTAALEYVASYGDLTAAFGTDAAAGWDHFLRHGLAEGRTAGFDGRAYIASYGDLSAFLGADESAGAAHWINHGRFEGRSVSFDPAAYLAANADLRAVFGPDTELASTHYIQYGRAEGRVTQFDGKAYAASYDDLAAAFGTDGAAATRHFVTTGTREGRASSFDAAQYTATYTDLIRAFGANGDAATEHYLRYGRAEGRVRDDFDAGQYLNNYADLRVAFGGDEHAAALHYVRFGFNEGRTDELLG